VTPLAAIAFPPIDPIAFRLGPLAVHWYGIAYLVGFIVTGFVMRWLSRRWQLGLSDDDILEILVFAVVGVIVGARLGYVFIYGGGAYLRDPMSILRIWDGGMSFHGGLAGLLLAGVLAARTLRVPWLTICDLGCVGAPVGFFFGRIANFINGELWGRVTTAPWGVVFPNAGARPRHPSQLYEALLEGAVLLVVLVVLARRLPPRPRGELFGWFLALYGVFRIASEFFRQPDVQIGFLPAGSTLGQWLSAPLVLLGVFMIVFARRRNWPETGRAKPAR
jgi:phosphatidylglycerol:prolipoprotein diacylglycerol transferase